MNHSPNVAGADRRLARRANLKRLLHAKSIAFIGGSAVKRGIEYCRLFGFDGEVWAVHPTYDQIAEIRCVPSPRDLPGVPDAVFLAVSPERTIPIVAELAEMGAGCVVCYTAGFAEIEEGRLQDELTAAAGDRLALVGPNCIGVINFFDAVPVAIGNHGLDRPERGIAVIAQSGTITINIIGSDRSLPVGYLMSIGNQAVLDMADYVDAVADDPRVSAIVLYIEGLKDVRAFAAAAAKAFAKGIPIVALKAGLSETGRRIALSHTGSMAGAPELYQALFDRLGIISVNSFSELLETVKVVAFGEPPAGNRLSIETCSGTDSGYCADLADRFGVDLPQPDATVKEALRRVIPDIATPMNPIDVTMAQWADRDAQATSLLTLLQQPTDAAALIINFPQGAWRESYVPAIDAMVDVNGKTGLPCYVISNLAEGLPKDIRDRLIAHRIVPLQGIEDAFASLGRVARYVKRWDAMRAAGGPNAMLLDGTAGSGTVRVYDEWASKAWLREAGIAVPDGRCVATVDEAVAAAEEIGYPVVLKGAGPSLQHKSELGAVALGLPDGQAVRDIAEAMAKDIAGVEGFIVEAMVCDAAAEVIVGAKRDDLFGVSLLIGAGGILTELMRDVRNLLLPVTREEVRSAVDSLKIAPLLHGFRGRPPGDVEALVDAIVAIARHVEKDAARLSELDVNPLMVRAVGHGVVAVDALLTVIEPSS